MSDTNAAPDAPASAPASAPVSASISEVPVNTTPPSSPNPIGQQAPPKPVGDFKGSEHRPRSRSESIQAAFDKANAEGRPGAAKPKIGHNQPPDEDKLDLRKPPKEQHRESGRFARAPSAGQQPTGQQPTGQQQPGQQPGQQDQGRQQQPQAHRQLPEGTPYREPPPRFSERAKAEWHAAPEGVRGDVYRMHHEVERMHQHYRADKAVMDSIRNFHQMAQQHGTTLQKALGNYVGIEQMLRKDPIAAFETIVSNLNLHTDDGRKLGFRDIAYYALNQSPEAHKLIQAQNEQRAQNHQIGQLHQQQQRLAQEQQRMQYERQFTYTRSALDQYAETHPRLDELGDLIQRELALGFTLDQAYERANLLRPPTQADQTRTGTSAQTRSDKSIHGAPAGPSNGTGRRSDYKPSRSEALTNAFRRAGHAA